MDYAISLILLLLVVIPVFLYTTQPLFRRRKSGIQDDHVLSSLLAERDQILNAITDLDFDNTLGKIPTEEYPRRRSELMQRGAEILSQIDNLAPNVAPVPQKHGAKPDAVEAFLAQRRSQEKSKHHARKADDIEKMITRRRNEGKSTPAQFCSHCGKPVKVTDRFCPSCGKSL
jgi:rubrerythrin